MLTGSGYTWSIEAWRLLGIFVLSLVIGLAFGYWWLGLIIGILFYLLWHGYQAYRMEYWLRRGAKIKQVPHTTGLWQYITSCIYQIRKNEKSRKKKLALALKRYRSVVSALPDAAIVLTANNEIEWGNTVAQKLLGIDYGKDVGQRLTHLLRAPQLEQFFAGENPLDQLEITSPIDDQITLSIRRVKFGMGQSLILARDISKMIELERSRQAFVANASHELRTPLTVVSGYLEILEETELTERNKSAVTNAHDQAKRMKNIIEDLLVLSHMENQSRLEDSGDRVDVPVILKEMIDNLINTEQRAKDLISSQIENTLHLQGVETEVHSIFSNLISNAIKHTDDDVEISINWYQDNQGRPCFSVADQGPGIPPEHLAHLTERFYRIDTGRSREKGGTGLGLSIVKHCLRHYGGELKIESEITKGSVFTAIFPQNRALS